jgi:chitin disaccharide deacetylase
MKMTREILLIFMFLASFKSNAFAQQHIKLIVRADDMGYSNDIGIAIIKAHKQGIVTSASIMPTSPFFDEAVKMCKENPELAVGIHVTVMGTGLRPQLSPDQVPSLVNETGFFYDTREEFEKAKPDPAEIEMEITAQIEKVRKSGLHFVYLDWHMNPPESVEKLVRKFCQDQNLIFGQNLSDSSYGYVRLSHEIENWPSQILPDGKTAYYDITPLPEEKKQMFFDLLTSLKPGTWLLVMHPGLNGKERMDVTGLLCSQRAKEIIKMNNVQLISYSELLKEGSMKSKQ